ncbi:hypothetical protein CCACVL1_30935 [Corchorus capsularis]|uniref:Uncharacterized protein n=1 Tax=Corchorus capsularis TaxID=210143 RepID=A0A1R3FUL3_COCAP|nr:hypothetical protein CCACVL1_30935 [Corchorus capsularis]
MKPKLYLQPEIAQPSSPPCAAMPELRFFERHQGTPQARPNRIYFQPQIRPNQPLDEAENQICVSSLSTVGFLDLTPLA